MFDIAHSAVAAALGVAALTFAVPGAPPEKEPPSTTVTADGQTCVLHRIGARCVRLDDLNDPGAR